MVDQVRGDQPISPPTLQAARQQLRIVYYTDPLCSWSWAFEAQWRRLRYEFGERLQWSYCMGGMIADWQQYADPLNDVSRPGQMAPQWYHVRTLSGMPLDEGIWLDDPPSSSYPACLAVKAAERQGADYGERYLRRVREAVMVEGENVARRECLLELAADIAGDSTGAIVHAVPPPTYCTEEPSAEQSEGTPPFDVAQFSHDLADETTVAGFRRDLQDISYRDIRRFPTLAIFNPAGAGIVLMGYRPYAALRQAVARLMPELTPLRQAHDALQIVRYWGRITAPEVAEALEQEPAQVEQALAAYVAQRILVQDDVFYQMPAQAPADHASTA